MTEARPGARKPPRSVVFAAFLLVYTVAIPSAAEASEGEPPENSAAGSSEPEADEATEEGEEKERLNGLSFGAAYTFHILRDRTSATTGEPLRTAEHLGGFVIGYQRELIPQHLAL
ncbi:MAG: hypothetical protein JRF54_13345, partial [Deltaproteobacteria bacterium]|nr:hypothetical protein [Deltaproteobacteria bacterium]